MNISLLIRLLMCHVFGDVVWQSETMGRLKAYSILWLAIHSAVVSTTFWFILGQRTWIFLLMFISHFAIDFVTSRYKHYLFKDQEHITNLTAVDNICHTVIILLIYFILR